MPRVCAFKNCDAVNNCSSLFIFPKNEQIFHKWAFNSGRFELIGKNLHWNRVRPYLCDKHFRVEDIEIGFGNVPNRLRKGAIPLSYSSNLKLDGDHDYSRNASQIYCSHKRKDNSGEKELAASSSSTSVRPVCIFKGVRRKGYVKLLPKPCEDTQKRLAVFKMKPELCGNVDDSHVDVGIQCKKLVKEIPENQVDVGIQCKEVMSNIPINKLTVQFQPKSVKDIAGNQFDVGLKTKPAKNIPRNQFHVGIQCNLNDLQSTRNVAIQTIEDYQSKVGNVSSLKKKLRAKTNMVLYYKNKLKKESIMRKSQVRGPVLNKGEDFLQEAKHWISGPFFHVLSAQVQASKKRNLYYNDNLKHIAHTLHFAGPTMYKTLGNIMKLPNERTLRGWILGLRMQAGVSTPLFELLKSKVSAMSDKEKVVCIYFDEISLKPTLEYEIGSDEVFGVVDCGIDSRTDDPASSALVCMIRGLFVNWKQPISFIFTEGTAPQTQLDNFVSGNLSELTNVGLFPVCITTNLGINFRNYFENRGASVETPFIVHNEKQIFIMPDTPHLIKSVVNCLISETIITRDGSACWDDITTCYDVRIKKKDFRSIPNVKLHSISLPPVGEKINLSLATHVLSNSTSTAISTMVMQQCMRDDAKGTASLCARFNNLFDILNSSVRNDPAPFKKALLARSESYDYLRGSLSWLDSLQIVDDINEDVTHNFPWIQDWKQAIHAATGLLGYLKREHRLKHILTRRLCLEDLENLFDNVLGDDVDEDPSCRDFVNVFKKVSCMHIRCPPKSDNSEFDAGAAILEFASEMKAHSP